MCAYIVYFIKIYTHTLSLILRTYYDTSYNNIYILRVYILYVCMHAHLKYSAVTYNKKFRFCNLRYGGKNIIHI